MREWFQARWQAFADSFDPEEVIQGSSPLAVLIAPGGFALVFAVIGYLPSLRRMSEFEAPWVSVSLMLLGGLCSLAAAKWQCRGPIGITATLLDNGFYSAAVSWAAWHSIDAYAVGFAAVGAIAVLLFTARVYGFSTLLALVVWAPPLIFFLVSEPHPAAAIILACACIMSILTMHYTDKRHELERGHRRLELALGATDKVLDVTMQRALTATLLNIGNFLHELRNVQTAMRMNLEFVRAQPIRNEEVASALEDALDASRTEQALIDETLEDLRRQAQPREDSLLVEETIHQAIAGHGPKPEITVRGSAPHFRVAGEPGHLLAVMRNLFRNARQAGAARVEVDLKVEPNGHAVDIVVRDNGPGIPKSRLPELFRPFLSSNKIAGTGLGLYLSRRYVELMRGTIRAQNSVQGGAEFGIRLPGKVALSELALDAQPLALDAEALPLRSAS